MNTASLGESTRQFPMRELEQIEQALRAMDESAAALRQRRDQLTQQLDALTQPSIRSTPPVRQVITRGFQWGGTHTRCVYDIDIYVGVLKILWDAFADKRVAMAAAAARCGTVRTYVATSPQALFPGLPSYAAARHGRRLTEGWYVDTNLNTERKLRVLRAVVGAAGLTWGKDLKVFWQPTSEAV